jgi:hypothetical protein
MINRCLINPAVGKAPMWLLALKLGFFSIFRSFHWDGSQQQKRQVRDMQFTTIQINLGSISTMFSALVHDGNAMAEFDCQSCSGQWETD